MTEDEWLDCTNPLKMLYHLQAKARDRKSLLLSCACFRRHWEVLSEGGREWVLLAEGSIEQRLPDADLFGDHWDGQMGIPGEDWGAWDGVSGAIDQVWCAYYECDDYDTLTGNRDWQTERHQQAILVRDIFGNPFRPVSMVAGWLIPTVQALGQAAYDNRILPAGTLKPDRLAVLADALEDVGCDNAILLTHLREPGPHVRGCWAVDLILGEE
jgi:hypothetical protein